MHDPAVLIIFARSLQTSNDPGILYRRFVSHVQALETTHLIGPGIPNDDERQIRHIVSSNSLYYSHNMWHFNFKVNFVISFRF